MSKATWAGLGATLLPWRSASPARQGGPRASSAQLTAPKGPPSAPQCRLRLPGGAEAPRPAPCRPQAGPRPLLCELAGAVCFPVNRKCSVPETWLQESSHICIGRVPNEVFSCWGKKNVKGERETLPDGLGNFPLPSLGTEYLCFSRPVLPAAEGARVGFRLSTACRGSHRWGTCPVQLRLPLSPDLGKSSHLGCRKPGPWPQRGLVKLRSKGRKKAKAYNLKPGAPANK